MWLLSNASPVGTQATWGIFHLPGHTLCATWSCHSLALNHASCSSSTQLTPTMALGFSPLTPSPGKLPISGSNSLLHTLAAPQILPLQCPAPLQSYIHLCYSGLMYFPRGPAIPNPWLLTPCLAHSKCPISSSRINK